MAVYEGTVRNVWCFAVELDIEDCERVAMVVVGDWDDTEIGIPVGGGWAVD
jgi:hypothetical protein